MQVKPSMDLRCPYKECYHNVYQTLEGDTFFFEADKAHHTLSDTVVALLFRNPSLQLTQQTSSKLLATPEFSHGNLTYRQSFK